MYFYFILYQTGFMFTLTIFFIIIFFFKQCLFQLYPAQLICEANLTTDPLSCAKPFSVFPPHNKLHDICTDK